MQHVGVRRRTLGGALAATLVATMTAGLTGTMAEAATGGTELYAVGGATAIEDEVLPDQALYRVDATDGSTTKVVDLQIDGVRGMDFSPLDNELYVHEHDDVCPGSAVHRLDMTDGSTTSLVDTDLRVPDAAFAPDGTFYVWDDEGNCRDDDTTGSDDLWAVDIETGTVTELGDSGISTAQTGVAVAPDGTIWMITSGELHTIDPDDGSGTSVINTTGADLDNALTFGPDGTMYGIDRDGGTTMLYMIDPTDGSTTLVGDMGVQNVTAIAFRDANPTAVDDEGSVVEGGTVDLDVLANDSDPEGSDLTPTVVDAPTNGTTTVNPDGTITYAHDGSNTVSDEFTYSVSDGVNASEPATVSITIDPTGLRAIVLGGPMAVSDDVVTAIDDIVSEGPTTRYAGADRYETAADISAETFAPGVPVAYVANASTDEKYPDALAGGPSAARNGGPVLLLQQDTIPDVVKAELDRLDPENIVILGGVDAVAPEVADELEDHTGGEVFRWGGADRFETAAIVSARTFDPGVDAVWIATGRNFADALAAGSAAFRMGAPVLLVEPGSIPPSVAAELDRLDPADIYVAGGPMAIDESVAAELADHTDGDVTRVFGDNRYETAAEISERFFGGTETAFIATGLKFPDALAGVVPAALADAPILLVDAGLPSWTAQELERLEDEA